MKTGDLVIVLKNHWRIQLIGSLGLVLRTDPQKKNALVLLTHNSREAWFHVDTLELYKEKT